MKNSPHVTDFQIIERHPGYDVVNNPLRFTVADLMPIGISWKSNGIFHAIENQDGVIGVLLNDLSGIAVVEAPYHTDNNRAYIVNPDGMIKMQLDSQTNFGRVSFYEVLYINDHLAFLAATPKGDIRIEVNDKGGIVINIAEIR
jgi:hypothetical protein